MKRELNHNELDIVSAGGFPIIQRASGGSTVDSNMQMATLNLKQSEDKFSQVTGLVQTIMANNNSIFGKIMSNC
jgi:hypothetical protein